MYLNGWKRECTFRKRVRSCVVRQFTHVYRQALDAWRESVSSHKRILCAFKRMMLTTCQYITIRVFEAWSEHSLASLSANRRVLRLYFRAWGTLLLARKHSFFARYRACLIFYMRAWIRAVRIRVCVRKITGKTFTSLSEYGFDSWLEYTRVRKKRRTWCKVMEKMSCRESMRARMIVWGGCVAWRKQKEALMMHIGRGPKY